MARTDAQIAARKQRIALKNGKMTVTKDGNIHDEKGKKVAKLVTDTFLMSHFSDIIELPVKPKAEAKPAAKKETPKPAAATK